MAHPSNPMDSYHKHATPQDISSIKKGINGIACTIYGLSELPKDVSALSVVWLLHPRLQTAETMTRFAAQAITVWNSRPSKGSPRGLIGVAFDQRNHGSRLTEAIRNEAWRQGNPKHAEDMYATYKGTADDVSSLITELPKHLPSGLPEPDQHISFGVSLGAHAAWQNIIEDRRITAAVSIVGCPDFQRLMAQRASKSKLADWDSSTPKGTKFFGSPSFPDSLVDWVEKTNPAGKLMPIEIQAVLMPPLADPKPESLSPALLVTGYKIRLNRTLKGKAVLNMSGGKDKLVPYSASKTFLDYLKAASQDGEKGWWKNNQFTLEDIVFKDAGHEATPEMVATAVAFICGVVGGDIFTQVQPVKGVNKSKI
jgi:pimeloyl-ACP methyl ester carboxylesterase